LQNSDYKNIIEAILFGSDSELSLKQIKDILESFKINLKTEAIEKQIDELNEGYIVNGSSFEIIKIAGGYQFATRKEYAPYVGKLYAESQKKKLSQSALETLSVIAYKQPVTRNEIEFVRGVNVDYIVNSLLERELISIVGRANTPGRPILYGTTKNFLRVIGLNSLEDLPKLREINDILKTERIEGITEADIDLFNSMNESEAGAELIIPESPENTKETSTQDESGESLRDIEEEKIEDSTEDEISQSDKEDNQITENYINTEEKKEEDNDRQPGQDK
jgi:segregation and condensation protein B